MNRNPFSAPKSTSSSLTKLTPAKTTMAPQVFMLVLTLIVWYWGVAVRPSKWQDFLFETHSTAIVLVIGYEGGPNGFDDKQSVWWIAETGFLALLGAALWLRSLWFTIGLFVAAFLWSAFNFYLLLAVVF